MRFIRFRLQPGDSESSDQNHGNNNSRRGENGDKQADNAGYDGCAVLGDTQYRVGKSGGEHGRAKPQRAFGCMDCTCDHGAHDYADDKTGQRVEAVDQAACRDRAGDGSNKCAGRIESMIDDRNFVAEDFEDGRRAETDQGRIGLHPFESVRKGDHPGFGGEGDEEKRKESPQAAGRGEGESHEEREGELVGVHSREYRELDGILGRRLGGRLITI